MGDIADMMLDGTLCEGCGVYLEGESFGVPRYCSDCYPHAVQRTFDKVAPSKKERCPDCGKRVKAVGLKDHQRAKHGAWQGVSDV